MGGVEFRRLTIGREASNNPLGLFNFAAGTAGIIPLATRPQTLFSVWQPTIKPRLSPSRVPLEQWRDGFFVLDNWQATQRLTINYGLRYDLADRAIQPERLCTHSESAETALIPPSNATSGCDFCPHPRASNFKTRSTITGARALVSPIAPRKSWYSAAASAPITTPTS